MTADEPLLCRHPTGWGWGPWQGAQDPEHCCVISRSLGCSVTDIERSAPMTPIVRTLTYREYQAVVHADCSTATDEDREVILKLAAQMGVEP